MKLTFGTVRPAEEAPRVAGPNLPERLPRAELAPALLVRANERAKAMLEEARQRAEALIARAQAEVAELRAQAEAEGRAEGAARLAVQALALHEREARADERALDRSVALARLLAERLLGEQLTLDPSRVAALARSALAEARGARTVTVVANPEDVSALERALAAGELPRVTRIVPQHGRPRGSLRLETEIGVLDADIAPELDRLAARLRETLRHES